MTQRVGGAAFFADSTDDDELELRNAAFWEAMLDHVRRDGFAQAPKRVLDIGCHRGGLLARIADLWKPAELIGIEPIATARSRARLRLGALASSVQLLGTDEWSKVSNHTVDLVVCHEVLFLIANLDDFAASIARVLAPGGRAYIAAGCHAENPVWPAWQRALEAQGRCTFTHQPMALMAAAASHGLLASVRPLRDGGWATHDPSDGPFTFPTVAALLDHQFRQKLLFRLVSR